MKKQVLIVLMLVTMLFTGCAAKAIQNEMAVGADSVYSEEKGAAPPMAEAPRESGEMLAPEDVTTSQERIVIRNADLTIVVVDPIQSQKNITKMTESLKGYVVNSYLYKVQTESGVEVPEANITIRVPADKLNQAIDIIKQEVKDPNTDVLNEQVSGQDVTMEYTDLQSRLRNLEAARDQLMEFMDKADTTEEVMMVYNQLVTVNEQIEVLKGQIKYYDESSQMSAISLRIRAEESVKPLTIGKWQPVGVARDAVQALISTFKFLVNAFIWIVILVVPIALVIYLVVRLIIWIIRKLFVRKPKKNTPPPADAANMPPHK